jgi:hypothetical protein
MARRVFFSFHYEIDIWRVSRIRNSWITKPDRDTAGFWDAASWETVQRQGEDAVKRWINRQLEGTSVTVVCIGEDTANRPYVQYEIDQSYEKGNALLGIYIHNMKDQNGYTSYKGKNPLDLFYVESGYKKTYFSEIYPTYDWVNDDGYNNISDWIEEAIDSEKQ